MTVPSRTARSVCHTFITASSRCLSSQTSMLWTDRDFHKRYAIARRLSSQIMLLPTISRGEEGHMSHALDSVDRQIIHILQQDGRTSNVEISRQIGMSEATVRKRLDRLVSAQMIRITAVPDASIAGFSTIAFMTLSVDLAQVGQIADRIAQLPEVRAIHLTTGGSELLLEAWFTSSDALLRFMTQHIGGIPGIRRMAISQVLRTIKDGGGWVLPFTSLPCSATTTDEPEQDRNVGESRCGDHSCPVDHL